MGLLGILKFLQRDNKLTEFADAVAIRSLEQVWPLVETRAATLGPNELRGYVRARSQAVLTAQIEQIERQSGAFRATVRTRIEELALQSLVKLIEARRQTAKSIATSRRRAA